MVLLAPLIFSAVLLCIFVLLAFKYKNLKAVNFIAILFSLLAVTTIQNLGYDLYSNIFLFYSINIASIVGIFFVVGGIISTAYFSKYYGEIILKCGSIFFIISALLSIIGVEISYIFYERFILIFILLNIAQIIFWIMYFKTLSSKTNPTLLPKNDPKDW